MNWNFKVQEIYKTEVGTHSIKRWTGKVNRLPVVSEAFHVHFLEQSRLRKVFGNLKFAIAPFLINFLSLADPAN